MTKTSSIGVGDSEARDPTIHLAETVQEFVERVDHASHVMHQVHDLAMQLRGQLISLSSRVASLEAAREQNRRELEEIRAFVGMGERPTIPPAAPSEGP